MAGQDEKVILFPSMVESLLKKAIEAREEKRFEEAQRYVLPILQFSPRHPVALLTLALVLYDARCFEEAAELFLICGMKGLESAEYRSPLCVLPGSIRRIRDHQ